MCGWTGSRRRSEPGSGPLRCGPVTGFATLATPGGPGGSRKRARGTPAPTGLKPGSPALSRGRSGLRSPGNSPLSLTRPTRRSRETRKFTAKKGSQVSQFSGGKRLRVHARRCKKTGLANTTVISGNRMSKTSGLTCRAACPSRPEFGLTADEIGKPEVAN